MSFSLSGSNVSRFQLNFEICPIYLASGIASQLPGGLLPITTLLSPGGAPASLNQAFAHFKVLPGGKLISNDYGKYPFANIAVAANAAIVQPKTLSLAMYAPAAATGAMYSKLTTISAMKATLEQHTVLGGYYVVCTAAYVLDTALLLDIADITPDEKKPQEAWQWDFWQPLLTQAQAQQAQNNMMSKITAGVKTDGATSGTGSTVGSSVGGAAPAAVPGSNNLGGTVQGNSPLQTDALPNTAATTA